MKHNWQEKLGICLEKKMNGTQYAARLSLCLNSFEKRKKKQTYTNQSPLKEFWITVLNTNVDSVFSLVLLSRGNRDSSLMLSALVTIWLFFYFSNLDNAHREQARRELIWDDVRSPDCCQLWTGGVQRSLYKRITEAFVCIWQTAQSLL